MLDRKLPENLENPIDNIIINYGKILYPLYKNLHFTPNTLTTISLLLSLLSSYCFYKRNYILSSILYFLSYTYDVFDGNYARKYNLVTELGDYYDHIKDLVCFIIFLIIFYYHNRLSKSLKIISIITILIFFVLSCLHLGFQEIYVSKNDSKNISFYLSFLKNISDTYLVYDNIKIIKYFGVGSLNFLVCIIIILNIL